MTVGELINELKQFDEDMEVKIGMIQQYGSNFAMDISDSIEEYNIKKFYGEDEKAVVLIEDGQIGIVDYDN